MDIVKNFGESADGADLSVLGGAFSTTDTLESNDNSNNEDSNTITIDYGLENLGGAFSDLRNIATDTYMSGTVTVDATNSGTNNNYIIARSPSDSNLNFNYSNFSVNNNTLNNYANNNTYSSESVSGSQSSGSGISRTTTDNSTGNTSTLTASFEGKVEFKYSYDFTFKDIWLGYFYLSKLYPKLNFCISGKDKNYYTNLQNSSADATQNSGTFYDVGNVNGYLLSYRSNTGIFNFVSADIKSLTRNQDYLNFNMSNGTAFQTQTGSSVDDIFRYSTDGQNVYSAKIGFNNKKNTITYEDGISYYSGGQYDDVIKTASYDSKNIWLDGSQGVLFDSIENIDATNSTGDHQLVGNSGNNIIRAGYGKDQLWGQAGNDTLFGGAGDNVFYYGVNEGSDVIYNSSSTDEIDLYNVSLSDIYSYSFDGSSLRLNMSGGESLTIVGQDGASNFVLADRSGYSYNRLTDTWTPIN